jgi:hypothetical protein
MTRCRATEETNRHLKNAIEKCARFSPYVECTGKAEMQPEEFGDYLDRDDVLALLAVGNKSQYPTGPRNTIGGMLKDTDTGEVYEPLTTDLSDFPDDLPDRF